MTDTPLTDAAYANGIHMQEEWRDFASRMERERAELVAALADAAEAMSYAASKLNTPGINGHRVLAERLASARAVLAKVKP
jgi:hypothetical protein